MTSYWKKDVADVNNKLNSFFLILAFLLTALFQGCINEKDCAEDIIEQKYSPNKQFVGVLMQRNCGMTSSPVNHLNLRQAEKDFERNPSTNEILQGQVFRIPDGFVPSFEWVTDNKLKILCSGCLKAGYIGKLENWENVEIIYEFPNN